MKQSGSDVDSPPTIQPLQNLEYRSPPARPPVSSQTIQSEMSHRQGHASPLMLGAECGGHGGRRDLVSDLCGVSLQ